MGGLVKITKESQIRKGMVIFIVYNHNGYKDIKKSKVLSKPYKKEFMDGHAAYKIDVLNDSIYLNDFGINANYNENRLFTTMRESKNHIKKGGIYTNDYYY